MAYHHQGRGLLARANAARAAAVLGTRPMSAGVVGSFVRDEDMMSLAFASDRALGARGNAAGKEDDGAPHGVFHVTATRDT